MPNGKLLVMDDEDLVRTVAGKMLEFLGYEVVLARSGEQALELYGDHRAAGKPFDAVLLDWLIPDGMDGYRTMEGLRALDANAKGILSSGFPEPAQDPATIAAGFTAVIGKPYELKTLQRIVEQVVGKAQAQA